MRETLPILRARRERRLNRQRQSADRRRGAAFGLGAVFSLILAALFLVAALAYADLTRGLPPVELLPRLLNPPDGLLLQPTRIYDRTGEHLLLRFAPDESPRGYSRLNPSVPNHLPQALSDGVIALADPQFREHNGYLLQGWQQPDLHPTLAQRLVSDLLLYDEPPSTRRALRERILAAQITARFGRQQVLEWYLNSANYGHQAYGAEAAAQLYFGKTAGQLNLTEAAILVAAAETPALNPLDAPQAALQRGREIIHIMQALGLVSQADAERALTQAIAIQPPPEGSQEQTAPAFINLVLAQLESRYGRARIERGGLTIFTTLDYDLQQQAVCTALVYAARVEAAPDPALECAAARLLPSLPPGVGAPDSSSSALILDSANGQVLALVGETLQGRETPLASAHEPGTLLTPFIFLTGFTRGLSPASLVWDIPGQVDVQNFDGLYHGPVRARIALANDYRVPAEAMMQQMGVENIASISASFGLRTNASLTMLELAGAYGALGSQGVYFGQEFDERFSPVTVLRVEAADRAVLLDWSTPEARPVVAPGLAYLVTHVLSDGPARWPSLGDPNPLEIGRPAAAKLGQTPEGRDAWAIGYTPSRVVVAWTGARLPQATVPVRLPAVLWNALIQTAVTDLPRDGWAVPDGVSVLNVCDPSGLPPTEDCPNVVSEVFTDGNEPIQADTLFRAYAVNRETGLLATIFTPPQLVEQRVYMRVPPEAAEWAASAGIPIPPAAYDAIQPPPPDPDVNISAPALFAEVSGEVRITGTAAGEDFVSYRLQAGRGLNPREWIQIGQDQSTPVQDGLLAVWDTTGLSGLYALQLTVVRSDQRLESAAIQVTIDSQ
jgi:membrane peptidoglycan carboxypeptidase